MFHRPLVLLLVLLQLASLSGGLTLSAKAGFESTVPILNCGNSSSDEAPPVRDIACERCLFCGFDGRSLEAPPYVRAPKTKLFLTRLSAPARAHGGPAANARTFAHRARAPPA